MFGGRIMVAAFLILGIVAGLGTAAAALILGHALWIVVLAYMMGGMLGMGLSLSLGSAWRLICARLGHRPCLGISLVLRHGH